MKKLIAFFVVFAIMFSLVACDIEISPKDDKEDPVGGDTGEYKYTDFSGTEKNLFTKYIGKVIPFLPCNDYYVEGYYDTDDYEHGINYYTVGNSEAEFTEYLSRFTEYTPDGTKTDEHGNTWYTFTDGDLVINVAYYLEGERYYTDVFVRSSLSKDDDGSDDTGSGDTGNTDHTYTDFNDDEKSFIEGYIDMLIPFIPCDEYYVEEYNETADGYKYLGINYYTFDNTEAEFLEYLTLFDSFVQDGSDVDEFGDTWYYFSKGNVCVDVSFYYYEDSYVMDLYAYIETEDSGSGDTGSGDTGNTDHTYTDFNDDEKSFIEGYIDMLIPFIPCDEYYVEEYNETADGYKYLGINYYTFDNTEAEFLEYLALFDSFVKDGSDADELGNTWYYFSKGNVYIDVTFYYYDGSYVMDLFAYIETEDSGSGNTGSGDTGSGDTGSGSVNSGNVITNEGAGLPDSADGVFAVDFTKPDKIKNVTDLTYYVDGCPTTGSPAVLVIPVEFEDSLADDKNYTVEAIEQAFLQGGKNDYYSVFDYYYISSYGQLELDITVLDYWFKPEHDSSYYYSATYDYDGTEISIGDQLIIDEALAHLEGEMDLSKFDSDGNDVIDAIVLVNTLDVGKEDFYWAYRYWNVYTDDDGYFYEYDGVSANDYLWASYQFLLETYDDAGNVHYEDGVMNTYTFIHEFGHILGLDDYYDTEYVNQPMAGCDVMDSMNGDHNAYSKFNLGWITTSRLVVTDGSVTLNLEAFYKSGDTIIIANNWDESLGAYQEYYVLVYYRAKELNSEPGGYFLRDGIVVYHVNSSLCYEQYGSDTYYYVYNNNTDPSNEYGTEDNLIEYVKSSADTYTYGVGDTLPDVTDDQGHILGYTFVVDSLTEDVATVTFTAK